MAEKKFFGIMKSAVLIFVLLLGLIPAQVTLASGGWETGEEFDASGDNEEIYAFSSDGLTIPVSIQKEGVAKISVTVSGISEKAVWGFYDSSNDARLLGELEPDKERRFDAKGGEEYTIRIAKRTSDIGNTDDATVLVSSQFSKVMENGRNIEEGEKVNVVLSPGKNLYWGFTLQKASRVAVSGPGMSISICDSGKNEVLEHAGSETSPSILGAGSYYFKTSSVSAVNATLVYTASPIGIEVGTNTSKSSAKAVSAGGTFSGLFTEEPKVSAYWYRLAIPKKQGLAMDYDNDERANVTVSIWKKGKKVAEGHTINATGRIVLYTSNSAMSEFSIKKGTYYIKVVSGKYSHGKFAITLKKIKG